MSTDEPRKSNARAARRPRASRAAPTVSAPAATAASCVLVMVAKASKAHASKRLLVICHPFALLLRCCAMLPAARARNESALDAALERIGGRDIDRPDTPD